MTTFTGYLVIRNQIASHDTQLDLPTPCPDRTLHRR